MTRTLRKYATMQSWHLFSQFHRQHSDWVWIDPYTHSKTHRVLLRQLRMHGSGAYETAQISCSYFEMPFMIYGFMQLALGLKILIAGVTMPMSHLYRNQPICKWRRAELYSSYAGNLHWRLSSCSLVHRAAADVRLQMGSQISIQGALMIC